MKRRGNLFSSRWLAVEANDRAFSDCECGLVVGNVDRNASGKEAEGGKTNAPVREDKARQLE